MSEPFIGQIVMFGGNFAPRGWALCDGQLLPISSNSALFSILGTTYGGDGVSTFGLPDLRGRSPMHPGSGPGLTPRQLGQKGGAERVTLTTNQLPAHSHDMELTSGNGTTNNPVGVGTNSTWAQSVASSDTGGGQAHDNMAPFLCTNFIIALQGTYPSRS